MFVYRIYDPTTNRWVKGRGWYRWVDEPRYAKTFDTPGKAKTVLTVFKQEWDIYVSSTQGNPNTSHPRYVDPSRLVVVEYLVQQVHAMSPDEFRSTR